LKRKTLNIVYVIFGLVIIYIVSAKPLSNYISEQYGFKMNSKRIDLGLKELSNDWKLDSICSLKNDYNKISESHPIFENDVYLEIWSNKNSDTSVPFHKTKEIYYEKSFWLWKNQILMESDYFHNPISELEYEELYSIYDFKSKKWFSKLDTLETEYKIKRDLKIADSLGLWLCGTGLFDSELDTIGLSKPETDKILKSWELK
jgi:hypothetical protein